MKHIKVHYRAIWISDIHLGSRGCKAEQLLSFLKSVECEYLYLVGDIFDLISMRRNGIYWHDSMTAVIRHILKMVKRGTKVLYITGNHDEFMRSFSPLCFGSEIEILNEVVHVTSSDNKLMVIHGDKFDFVVGKMKWLTLVGSQLYDCLLVLNGFLHHIRVKMGFTKYWSLSACLKAKAKQAISFIADFETAAKHYALINGCFGVVCGHIHTPKIEHGDLCRGELGYYNCGDWVESLTAIVENSYGQLELIKWHDLNQCSDTVS